MEQHRREEEARKAAAQAAARAKRLDQAELEEQLHDGAPDRRPDRGSR
jgi:hypothetical protein